MRTPHASFRFITVDRYLILDALLEQSTISYKVTINVVKSLIPGLAILFPQVNKFYAETAPETCLAVPRSATVITVSSSVVI